MSSPDFQNIKRIIDQTQLDGFREQYQVDKNNDIYEATLKIGVNEVRVYMVVKKGLSEDKVSKIFSDNKENVETIATTLAVSTKPGKVKSDRSYSINNDGTITQRKKITGIVFFDRIFEKTYDKSNSKDKAKLDEKKHKRHHIFHPNAELSNPAANPKEKSERIDVENI